MKKEVIETSENARINLSDDEAEGLAEDFKEVLSMFETLQKVDTEGLKPSFHPVPVEKRSREDESEDSISDEEVFRNTENVQEGFFKGPSAR